MIQINGSDGLRKPGLDLLRLTAAMLVFYQHCLSSCNLDNWIDVGSFRIGRVGTSLFFMLAGLLAAQTGRSPGTWFRDRLITLFPPFWIVTLFGFLIAWWTRFKPFDFWQVACQMSGIGYFTHGEKMVNVATWFMSPLLLLYFVAMAGRLLKTPSVTALTGIAVAFSFSLMQAEHQTAVYCHCVTFFVSFLVGKQPASRWTKNACSASLALLLFQYIQPEFRYGCVSVGLLGMSPFIRNRNLFATRFTHIAYEWFLVHGLCVTSIARQTHDPWIVIPVAMAVSIASAIILKSFIFRLKLFLRGPGIALILNLCPKHSAMFGLGAETREKKSFDTQHLQILQVGPQSHMQAPTATVAK